MSAGVDWFIPAHVRSGDLDVLRRGRLVVAYAWTLIALAIFYGATFLSMSSPMNTAALGIAAGVALAILYVMRRTGSCFLAGNLLTVAFFGVLTALACRLGGQGSLVLPWYAGAPVVALSTAGRRSAVFWLAVTASSLAAFHAIAHTGYSFPNDLAPHHYELTGLLAWIGLIVLMLALALLYEAAKSQTLAELRRAEETLRESEQRHRTLVDNIDLGISLIDADYRIVMTNSYYLKAFGRPLSQFVGKKCFAEFEQRDAVCPHCPGTRAMATGAPAEAETVGVRDDGRRFPVRLQTFPVCGADGTPTGFIEVAEDITVRRRAKEEIASAKRQIEFILGATKTGIDIIDSDFNVRYIDPEWQKVYGDPTGRKCYEYFMDRTESCPGCGVVEALLTKRMVVTEAVLVKEDNKPVQVTSLPFQDESGDWLVAEVNTDISERKRMERESGRALERQQKLNDLQQTLLGPGALAEKLTRITAGVVDIFDADFCRIWITQAGDRCESGCIHAEVTEGPHVCRYRDRCLHLLASSGRYTHIDGEVHRRVPFGCYKIGRVAADEDHRFLTNEATTDPRVHNHDWAKELGLVSFVGYQLRPPGEQTIGVLALFSKHAITPEEDGLLESLANKTAQVIETAWSAERLRESEERHRVVTETAQDAIITADVKGNIRLWNAAAEKIFGFTAAEAVGRNLLDLIVPPQYHEAKRRGLARFAHSGGGAVVGRTLELTALRKDGTEFPVEISVSSYGNGDDFIGVALVRDITARKLVDAELEELHHKLMQNSRQAGMSEVATDVLHNVGNVLNSVNVSAGLVSEQVRGSRVSRLTKAAALLSAHADDLGTFITQDERGKQLPGYLTKLAAHLAGEQADVLAELRHLIENIEHIKSIVSVQQSLSGVSGVREPVRIDDLLDGLLRMDASWFSCHGIDVVREYDEFPVVSIDKHKLTQILVNLLRNAKDALTEDQRPDKRLTVRLRRVPPAAGLPGDAVPTVPAAVADKLPVAPDHVRIEVADNAIGIPPENLTKIFAHGFTTKEDGHGFGLHGSALGAKELGGSLMAHSDGPGQGATFTLDVPL